MVPENIKQCRVLIAGPVAKGWMVDLRRAVYPLRETSILKAPPVYEVSGDPAYGRNKIIMDIMDRDNYEDVTHVFLVDSDTIPPTDSLPRLLSHDKDVMAAVYPMFHYPKALWSVMAYDPDLPEDCDAELIEYQDLPADLFRAQYFGGGAVLVRKEVFGKIEWPPFERTQDPRARYISEDFTFCLKARRAGLELWCDPIVRCMHRKHLDLLQLFDCCFKQFRS